MELLHDIKIISGGQTGVDRAALDYAQRYGIICGGYCPKGRRAEDGIIPENYPLIEISSKQYPARTKQNIMESDGTIILYKDRMDKGTLLTLRLCEELHKPLWKQQLSSSFDQKIFKHWLERNKICGLNFAGPRESFSPGIYDQTLNFMEKSFL